MRTPNIVCAAVALSLGFVCGSVLHPHAVQARGHLTAHIEQVFTTPMGRETTGSIAGFSCASVNGQEPQCYALVLSGN